MCRGQRKTSNSTSALQFLQSLLSSNLHVSLYLQTAALASFYAYSSQFFACSFIRQHPMDPEDLELDWLPLHLRPKKKTLPLRCRRRWLVAATAAKRPAHPLTQVVNMSDLEKDDSITGQGM
jgi:hypothetical protein